MKKVDYETMIFMHLSYACVFSCVYCDRHNPEVPEPLDIEGIVGRLDKLGKTLLVCLCGGEPFYVPNFTEFVQALTRKHYVRIDTNLASTKVCRDFITKVNPERIAEIVFSTHVLEREKRRMPLEDLIKLVKEYQAAGFPMVGNYVAYPPLMSRLEDDIRYFASHGIKVLPNFYLGSYDGKYYPEHEGKISYTQEEFDLITRLNPLAKLRVETPKGNLCNAGSTALCVNEKWEVFPCLNLRDKKLGDFFGEWKTFSKTIHCPNERCGDRYNEAFGCTLNERTDLTTLFLQTLERTGSYTEEESKRLLSGRLGRNLRNRVDRRVRLFHQMLERMEHRYKGLRQRWSRRLASKR